MNIRNANLSFRSMSYGNHPDTIVLHHAEASRCSVQSVHDWHKNGNGWAGIGYHYFVRKNGEIWKGRPDNAIGAHCPGMNARSIGICAEGAYTRESMPSAQKSAIIQLGQYLKRKYGITRVGGHKEYYSTDCPGRNYPLSSIKSSIMGGSYSGSVTSSSGGSSSGGSSSSGGGSYYLVKDVQRMLIKIGYPCGSSGADGSWGNGTYTAVKCFQRDCKLKADGWVGEDTYHKIVAEYNKKMGIKLKPAPKPVPKNLYRVRKSWSDAKSQKGAYSVLSNAKECCNANPGTTVYDNKGKAVYTHAKPAPKPVPKPSKPEPKPEPTVIMGTTPIQGKSLLSATQLANYIRTMNPTFDIEIAKAFIKVGTKYGIRGDIACCQSIHETGWFKFGGDVKESQHNYAGIGATGGVPGNVFNSVEQGVTAQLQHLYAYASKTTSSTVASEPVYDPRFRYVTRGCASNWEDLSGKWAVPGYDKNKYSSLSDAYAHNATYAQMILSIYDKAVAYSVAHAVVIPPKPTEPEITTDKDYHDVDSIIDKICALLKSLIRRIK